MLECIKCKEHRKDWFNNKTTTRMALCDYCGKKWFEQEQRWLNQVFTIKGVK